MPPPGIHFSMDSLYDSRPVPLWIYAGSARLADPLNLFNMVYLGWAPPPPALCPGNYAMKSLGAVRASVYIYLVPVITVVFSALILGEPVTLLSLIGMGSRFWGFSCLSAEVDSAIFS